MKTQEATEYFLRFGEASPVCGMLNPRSIRTETRRQKVMRYSKADGMKEKLVRSKINTLRSYFSAELKKVNNSNKSGAGRDDVYINVNGHIFSSCYSYVTPSSQEKQLLRWWVQISDKFFLPWNSTGGVKVRTKFRIISVVVQMRLLAVPSFRTPPIQSPIPRNSSTHATQKYFCEREINTVIRRNLSHMRKTSKLQLL
ncbi:uncharacterized protein LOC130625844 [Hydractinia symbiolongicarpus]|uniref:uncharacterized protein LOC130625844 n=1 Tax=Hydractinia symbiolongicarpus TaxID=13093 RepID=UPI00254FE63F|nr:uncharacterized protein LOC130625844 [Hydractinia symbiolongicarpus]